MVKTVLLSAVLLFLTIVRARSEGVTWHHICAYPSKWFKWTFFGAPYGETFSAYVGRRLRDDEEPHTVWHVLRVIIDALGFPFESHHCAESLYRLEQKNRSQ